MTSQHPEPMAADRKVLIIGLVAMVVFVAIGVTSAQVFTASACQAIRGEVADGSAASLASTSATDPSVAALTDLFGEVIAVSELVADGVDVAALPMVEIAPSTDGVWRSPVASDTVGDPRLDGVRVGAVGDREFALAVTTPDGVEVILVDDDGQITATTTFGSTARVQGDGDTLFVTAHVNDLTGQFDAMMPLHADLTEGDCVDTAVVGSPFAFHLAADRGQLLVLRVEEDADNPVVELRERHGLQWRTSVAVPVAPPGVLAERMTGGMSAHTVVLARRALAADEAPVIVMLDRATGDEIGRIDREELLQVIDPPADAPLRVRVMAVDDHQATVAVTFERDLAAQWLTIDLTTLMIEVLPSAPTLPVSPGSALTPILEALARAGDDTLRLVAVGGHPDRDRAMAVVAVGDRLLAVTYRPSG